MGVPGWGELFGVSRKNMQNVTTLLAGHTVGMEAAGAMFSSVLQFQRAVDAAEKLACHVRKAADDLPPVHLSEIHVQSIATNFVATYVQPVLDAGAKQVIVVFEGLYPCKISGDKGVAGRALREKNLAEGNFKAAVRIPDCVVRAVMALLSHIPKVSYRVAVGEGEAELFGLMNTEVIDRIVCTSLDADFTVLPLVTPASIVFFHKTVVGPAAGGVSGKYAAKVTTVVGSVCDRAAMLEPGTEFAGGKLIVPRGLTQLHYVLAISLAGADYMAVMGKAPKSALQFVFEEVGRGNVTVQGIIAAIPDKFHSQSNRQARVTASVLVCELVLSTM